MTGVFLISKSLFKPLFKRDYYIPESIAVLMIYCMLILVLVVRDTVAAVAAVCDPLRRRTDYLIKLFPFLSPRNDHSVHDVYVYFLLFFNIIFSPFHSLFPSVYPSLCPPAGLTSYLARIAQYAGMLLFRFCYIVNELLIV